MTRVAHSILRTVGARLSHLASFVQPCPACGARAGAPLCPGCRDASAVADRPWLAATGGLPLHFVGAYHRDKPDQAGTRDGDGRGSTLSPLGRALVAFKDRGDRYAGRCLARLFAEHCGRHASFVDAIVAVPPDPSRLRQRGFAPASWLAFALSRRCRVDVAAGSLERVPDRAAQRSLGGADRRRNAQGAFTLGGTDRHGYSVVLVDDVITTGATLTDAAACLEEAGVVVAFAAVLACADRKVVDACRSRTATAGTRSTAAPTP